MKKTVEYSEWLIQHLERSLASAFGHRALRLTRRSAKAHAGFHVSLAYFDRTVYLDDGSQQPVLEILVGEGEPSSFYFTFVAAFDVEITKSILVHSSVAVFQELYAGEVAPFFRAEWDYRAASDQASYHAQPHWHFVQRPATIEKILRLAASAAGTAFVPDEQVDTFATAADCGKFHFAMTSMWEKDSECRARLFESSEFTKWFESVAKYIAHQIAYLIAKKPVLREFRAPARPDSGEAS